MQTCIRDHFQELLVQGIFKSNFKIQALNKNVILRYSSVSLDSQTSGMFDYNPAAVNLQSLVHDPFRAANVVEEYTELPPLSPPNQSRSGNQTGSKRRKLNSDAPKVSTNWGKKFDILSIDY